MASLAVVLVALALGTQNTREAEHLVAGELAAINLTRRSLMVKTGDKPPRELEFAIEAATSIVSRGRNLRLEDLRPGEPVKILYRDEGRGRRAVVVKAGPSRHAVPTPSAFPSPRP